MKLSRLDKNSKVFFQRSSSTWCECGTENKCLNKALHQVLLMFAMDFVALHSNVVGSMPGCGTTKGRTTQTKRNCEKTEQATGKF